MYYGLILCFFVNTGIFLLKIFYIYLSFLHLNLETELDGLEIVVTEKDKFLQNPNLFMSNKEDTSMPNYHLIIQIQNNLFFKK
jgi:hypothetical protein